MTTLNIAPEPSKPDSRVRNLQQYHTFLASIRQEIQALSLLEKRLAARPRDQDRREIDAVHLNQKQIEILRRWLHQICQEFFAALSDEDIINLARDGIHAHIETGSVFVYMVIPLVDIPQRADTLPNYTITFTRGKPRPHAKVANDAMQRTFPELTPTQNLLLSENTRKFTEVHAKAQDLTQKTGSKAFSWYPSLPIDVEARINHPIRELLGKAKNLHDIFVTNIYLLERCSDQKDMKTILTDIYTSYQEISGAIDAVAREAGICAASSAQIHQHGYREQASQ